MRRIPLDRGMHAIVDDEDYELVSQYKWRTSKCAKQRYPYAISGRGFRLTMHGLITGAKGVDHRNRNGLDNRRSNLRLATTFQNQGNRAKNIGRHSSDFKGVRWNQGKWEARIGSGSQKTRYVVGRFTDEIEAARAYDAAALARWGEFARLNFPAP